MNFILVGFGGALGAMMRYGISLIPIKSTFPILTLVTNLLGAIAIGYIVGNFEKKYISTNSVLFLKIGVCGGFTTFSTFSLETYDLFRTNQQIIGIIYIIASIILCILGVALGLFLSRR